MSVSRIQKLVFWLHTNTHTSFNPESKTIRITINILIKQHNGQAQIIKLNISTKA